MDINGCIPRGDKKRALESAMGRFVAALRTVQEIRNTGDDERRKFRVA
jgi:hypothetical protein